MTVACISIVAGLATVLPTATVTLAWTHSVERTRWEEDYRASADGVTITEARIEAFGAGMEPPASAAREGRWWRYRPALPPMPVVGLANSAFAGGYSLCWDGTCRSLSAIVPQGQPVTITAAECPADLRPPDDRP